MDFREPNFENFFKTKMGRISLFKEDFILKSYEYSRFLTVWSDHTYDLLSVGYVCTSISSGSVSNGTWRLYTSGISLDSIDAKLYTRVEDGEIGVKELAEKLKLKQWLPRIPFNLTDNSVFVMNDIFPFSTVVPYHSDSGVENFRSETVDFETFCTSIKRSI